MQLKSLLSSAAVAIALAAPGVASATTESLNFSGAGQYGPINGQMVLDVVSGAAISGTGWISGSGIVGTDALTLITLSTPGANQYPYGIGWRDGSGTDVWGYDDLVPIDSNGGLVFSFGTPTPIWGQGYQFGIWSTGSDAYQGWLFGPSGVNDPFYAYVGTFDVTSGSTVPEPSTWLMIVLGLVGLGFVSRRIGRCNPVAL